MEETYQKELHDVTEQLVNIDLQMIEARVNHNRTKLKELFEKQKELLIKKHQINQQLILSTPPIKCNANIDLRKNDDDDEHYTIYLHNTTTDIGVITYRGYHTHDYFGDIGYAIDPDFRGHHYAYESLCLLSEKLYEEGIPDFWVGIHTLNIPSIKTVEKYGGKIIKTHTTALLFQCETRIQNIEHTKSKK